MEYKVEDLVLYNEKKNARKSILQEQLNYPYIFGWEHSMSEKEKIDFIDTYYKKDNQTGWATYMLDLINKYLSEKVNLPKDSYGYVKTVSLKAWLKKTTHEKLFVQSGTMVHTILWVVIMQISEHLRQDHLGVLRVRHLTIMKTERFFIFGFTISWQNVMKLRKSITTTTTLLF